MAFLRLKWEKYMEKSQEHGRCLSPTFSHLFLAFFLKVHNLLGLNNRHIFNIKSLLDSLSTLLGLFWGFNEWGNIFYGWCKNFLLLNHPFLKVLTSCEISFLKQAQRRKTYIIQRFKKNVSGWPFSCSSWARYNLSRSFANNFGRIINLSFMYSTSYLI